MISNLLLQNLISEYANPSPFETEAHSIHTKPLLREHLDSYLYYNRYKTYEITPLQTQFQIISNLFKTLIQKFTIEQNIHKT